jgi:inner membrane protein
VAPMMVCSGLSLLPDLDYLAVMLGVPDVGPCGHRGATHALALPLVVAAVAAIAAPRLGMVRWRLSLICGLVVASHLLLDAMTTSSRGVPLLWPVTFHRFELPWRPIPNAPCGLEFISTLGLRVASIELLLFLPLLVVAFWPPAVAPRKGPTAGIPKRLAPGRSGGRLAA